MCLIRVLYVSWLLLLVLTIHNTLTPLLHLSCFLKWKVLMITICSQFISIPWIPWDRNWDTWASTVFVFEVCYVATSRFWVDLIVIELTGNVLWNIVFIFYFRFVIWSVIVVVAKCQILFCTCLLVKESMCARLYTSLSWCGLTVM